MEDMGESIWSDNIGCCTYSGVVMVDGSEVAKMNKTFRQYAIDYIQNRHLCKGYVDYIVAELNKLDKIEQIVNEEMQIMESDLLWKIKEVLEQE